MRLIEKILQAGASLFVLYVFFIIFKELAEATGQSTFLFIIALIAIGVGIVASVFSDLRRL